jgi:hypothetical protein
VANSFDPSFKEVPPKEKESGARVVGNMQETDPTDAIVLAHHTDEVTPNPPALVPESQSFNSSALMLSEVERSEHVQLDERLRTPEYNSIPTLLILSVLPILVALAVIIVDPCTRLYAKAKLLDGNNNRAIEDYTSALKIRTESYILQARADLKKDLNQTNSAGLDYLKLYSRNNFTGDGDALEAMATREISMNGTTPHSLTLLRQAARLAARIRPNGMFGTKTTEGDISKIDFDLILCGDTSDIHGLSNLVFNDKGREEGEVQFLKAAALRELGQNKVSSEVLSKFDTTNYLGYKAGTQVYTLLALLQLDDKNGAAAERLLDTYKAKLANVRMNEKIENERSKRNNTPMMYSYTQDWPLKLASAWTAYNQGKYDEALKNSDDASQEFDDNQGDIAKSHGDAANHLLRCHIFTAQNLSARAEQELSSFHKSNYTGLFFIPKIYRQWLYERH